MAWRVGDEVRGQAWASRDEAEPLDHRSKIRCQGGARVDPDDRLFHLVFPRVESGTRGSSKGRSGGVRDNLRVDAEEAVKDGRDKGVKFLRCSRVAA